MHKVDSISFFLQFCREKCFLARLSAYKLTQSLFRITSCFCLYLEVEGKAQVTNFKESYSNCKSFIKHERTSCISQNRASMRSNIFLTSTLSSFFLSHKFMNKISQTGVETLIKL